MPSLNEINISYAMILGLNGLAAFALLTEFLTSRQVFIRYALIAQTLSFLWHAVNVFLTIFPESRLVLFVSSSMLTLSGLWFLAASVNRPRLNNRLLVGLSIAYLSVLWIDFFLNLGLREPLGFVPLVIYYGTPLGSLVFIKSAFRFPIAILQFFAAFTLFTGLVLLVGENAAIGALLYLIAALLIPLVSLFFVMLSTNYSRRRVAESERTYRVFFEAVDDVFFETDESLNVLNISPSVSQFGYTPEAIVGKNIGSFLDNGEDFLRLAREANKKREAFQLTGKLYSSEGPVDCELTCTPLHSENDRSVHFAGTIRNTHERNLLERQFINAQRHESLGKLAGGIAHDFNNILQGIMGHAELLKNYSMTDEKRTTSLEAITKGTASAGGLCRQLLLYTGTGANVKEDLNLGELITEIAEIMRPSMPDDCNLDVSRIDETISIRGDKAQIGQVVMNLIKNAIESEKRAVTVKVQLSRELISDPLSIEAQIASSLKPGEYAKLTVEDNGAGINAEIMSRIFDPFFTTKPAGHGLGLAAIVGILTAHDGTISVESQENEGARFTIWLPISEALKANKSVPTGKTKESLRVLHVDDEEGLLAVGRSMLEQMGHDVLTANSGQQATEIMSREGDDVDMLISDIKMPGMDGISLARRLLKQFPKLSVVLASGYADVSNSLSSDEVLRIEFLGKPYNYNDLLSALEKARVKANAADVESVTSGEFVSAT